MQYLLGVFIVTKHSLPDILLNNEVMTNNEENFSVSVVWGLSGVTDYNGHLTVCSEL